MLLDHMQTTCERLTQEQVLSQTDFSRSQLYEWRRGVRDRQERESKTISQKTVENAAQVIMDYPHMGGRKGQAYMTYHRLGYLSMKGYDQIKKSVGKVLLQEVVAQGLVPARTQFEHKVPQDIHEIWAEDFTDLMVYSQSFKLALLMDVASQYYLGLAISIRATAALVEQPVQEALEENDGQGPKEFILSDNGGPYVSDAHGRLLEKTDIVQKRIPAYVPQYNASMECGVKEFKNVFYNVWAKPEQEEADKEKSLLARVDASVRETAHLLNHVIPRPCLQGVTPADLHEHTSQAKIEANRQYVQMEQEKPSPPPWEKSYWEVVKEAMGLKKRPGLELLIKFCFFYRRPLRQITKLGLEGVG